MAHDGDPDVERALENVNKPVRKSRTQIKKDIQDVINTLVNNPCSFWACPGPNKPFEHMATCKVCWSVKELRKIKKEI